MTPALATPPTVTVTFPVVAPLGTFTVMLVSLQAVGEAGTPLNDTVLGVVAKPEPAITTDVPTAPLAGVRDVMAGAPIVAATSVEYALIKPFVLYAWTAK